MRIFHAAADSPNHWNLPGSRIWHNNLYLPLVDLGHDLVRFDHDFGPLNDHIDPTTPEAKEIGAALRRRCGEALVEQVAAAHARRPIDLLFTYFYSAFVEPDIIRAIADMGIVTVNWFCNASYQFHLVEAIAPAYDWCLVPERFRLDDYRRIGANPLHCQEAANPTLYHPIDVPLAYDVTFVGQRYGDRPDHIKALLSAGIDIRVFGPRWLDPPRQPRPMDDAVRAVASAPVDDDELVRMYSRSKISLGFTAVARIPADGSPPIRQVRLRDFEATMSGAFYLVEQFDEILESFEPDKEIVTFRSMDELVDKSRFYLAHDDARERIRLAGMRRARAEHTWHQRFRAAFAAMGMG